MENNKNKKPWDDSFENDRNQDGNLSRIELRKQKGNFKLILAVLLSIVALIALFSLAFGMSKQSSIQQNQPSSKEATKSTPKQKKSGEKKKSNNHQEKQTSSNVDSSVASSTSQHEASQSSDEKHHEYITVNQNEGIYRVAKNAGISVSQLQTLNGLNSNSVIAPGQKLRIK